MSKIYPNTMKIEREYLQITCIFFEQITCFLSSLLLFLKIIVLDWFIGVPDRDEVVAALGIPAEMKSIYYIPYFFLPWRWPIKLKLYNKLQLM